MIPQQRHPRALGDEELCTRAAAGDRGAEEALVLRYNRLVRMCARPYFLAGGDSEDLIQEGMVGLLTAIREYDPDKSVAFRSYAEVCIKNRLLSAIKAAARGKHTPLNNSVSFETPGSAADFTGAEAVFGKPDRKEMYRPVIRILLSDNVIQPEHPSNQIRMELDVGGESVYIRRVPGQKVVTLQCAGLQNPYGTVFQDR